MLILVRVAKGIEYVIIEVYSLHNNILSKVKTVVMSFIFDVLDSIPRPLFHFYCSSNANVSFRGKAGRIILNSKLGPKLQIYFQNLLGGVSFFKQ